jgi:predicted nucleic acid-binding protein
VSVVVDTSVWVDHFKRPNARLMGLLVTDLVLIHPMVVAEVACGTPPDRSTTIRDLSLLKACHSASVDETLDFIEREGLYGQGCGLIDLMILASTLMTPGARLWTLDRRLALLTARFKVAW